jgi:benzoate membrane transport protein
VSPSKHDFQFSQFSSALTAVLIGYGGTLALVLAAADALNATKAQSMSWVTGLCLSLCVCTVFLSTTTRKPVLAAWSTAGLALLAASPGTTSMPQAVGAFMMVGALIILTGLIKPIEKLIHKIPLSIASAMLAGLLFPFVLQGFQQLPHNLGLGLTMLGTFIVVRIISNTWASLTAMLTGGLWITLHDQINLSTISLTMPETGSWIAMTVILPEWHLSTLMSVGLPLYLITMLSQNLPGFAVLRASGYEPPARAILTTTGLASTIVAFIGTHTITASAVTASLCTGPDCHPDPKQRWLAGPVYGALYGLLALFSPLFVSLFLSAPKAYILLLAGLALLPSCLTALQQALHHEKYRFEAFSTFAVTASSIQLFGLASAFWGCIVGLCMLGISHAKQSYETKRIEKKKVVAREGLEPPTYGL